MRFNRQKMRSNCDLTSSTAALLPPFAPFARNQVWSAKTGVKLRFNILGGNPFARHEVRSAKAEVKLWFWSVRGNRFARNEANEVRSAKTEVKLRFWSVRGNRFARNEANEVPSSKTEVKLQFSNVRCNRFTQNEVQLALTEVKLRFRVVQCNLLFVCVGMCVVVSVCVKAFVGYEHIHVVAVIHFRFKPTIFKSNHPLLEWLLLNPFWSR
jgi:hypothetical protein